MTDRPTETAALRHVPHAFAHREGLSSPSFDAAVLLWGVLPLREQLAGGGGIVWRPRGLRPSTEKTPPRTALRIEGFARWRGNRPYVPVFGPVVRCSHGPGGPRERCGMLVPL